MVLMSARRYSPPMEISMMVTAFPIVGALEGALLAAEWEGARRLWSTTVSVFIVWATSLWIEWFHVDGLADTADALGQKRKPADALRIFKDSRIGVLAALAVTTVVVGRLVVLTAISPELMRLVLLIAPALAMWSRAITLYRAKPAYEKSLTGPYAAAFGTGWMLTSAAIALGGATVALGCVRGPIAFVVVTLIGLAVQRFGHRRLGGIVGDLIGLSQQLAWVAVLLVMSAHRS